MPGSARRALAAMTLHRHLQRGRLHRRPAVHAQTRGQSAEGEGGVVGRGSKDGCIRPTSLSSPDSVQDTALVGITDPIMGKQRAGASIGKPRYDPELELAKEKNRGERWKQIIGFGGWAALLATSALPLYVVYLMVRDLAGKNTVASFGITASVTLAGVAAVVKVLFDRAKMKRQARELTDLRTRCAELEDQLESIKAKRIS